MENLTTLLNQKPESEQTGRMLLGQMTVDL